MAEMIADTLNEAIADAASVERDRDWGMAWNRPSVEASRKSVAKFKARLKVFLLAMPEDATVRDILEELDQ